MLLRKLLLINMFIWCGFSLQASDVVSWLKGTYTPFVTDARLAEHKGLSPLMGAIAWHSDWIVGFYTWGVGQKQVERGAVQQQAGPAAAAPERVKITWKDNDATTELVRTLFREAGEGDIQPTISQTHPFFMAIVDADAEKLPWLLEKIINGDIPQKKSDIKIQGAQKFLALVAASRKQCGPGKRYPAWVTDQILSAYYYAIQFKPQVRKNDNSDNVTWMKAALDRYMHAIGDIGYKPTQYELDVLNAQECPSVIDEAVLVKDLYKLRQGDVPPFANYKNFAYRGADKRGTCVETMLHNFFNVLLYDAAKQRYMLDLLPASIKEHANKGLLAYYAHETNARVANTDNQDVHDAWAEVVSGLPGGVQRMYDKKPQAHEIEYVSADSKGFFEFASNPRNVLLGINTLLGTKAKSFEELSGLLSTDGRRVELRLTPNSDSLRNEFDFLINDKVLARFIIATGHSKVERINQCNDSFFEAVCGPNVEGKSLEQLQDILLMHTAAQITEQEARYLLYGAGMSNFDWVIKMANIFCPPVHGDALFASVADKLFDRSQDAWQQLNPAALVNNMHKENGWINVLLPNVVGAFNFDITKILVERGADVNAKSYDGEPLLIAAISFGGGQKASDVARVLIESGADVNAKNREGKSALGLAIAKRRFDVAQYLIAKGADINVPYLRDTSLLSLAIQVPSYSIEVVQALIERGADVNEKVPNVGSLLSIAIGRKNLDVIEALIAKGADVDATLLARAKNTGDKEIIALIERALAQKISQRGSPEPQAVPVAA